MPNAFRVAALSIVFAAPTRAWAQQPTVVVVIGEPDPAPSPTPPRNEVPTSSAPRAPSPPAHRGRCPRPIDECLSGAVAFVDATETDDASDGMAPAANGCASGQMVSARTAGRCCWPDQHWDDAAHVCDGPPVCPRGFAAHGNECVASRDARGNDPSVVHARVSASLAIGLGIGGTALGVIIMLAGVLAEQSSCAGYLGCSSSASETGVIAVGGAIATVGLVAILIGAIEHSSASAASRSRAIVRHRRSAPAFQIALSPSSGGAMLAGGFAF